MLQNIIVDGNLTSPAEWTDATVLNSMEPESSINATIYFKNNETYLAILCDAFGDETQNRASNEFNLNNLDHFDLGFDTGNDQIRTDGNENSFTLLANGTLFRWIYDISLKSYKKAALMGAIGAVTFGNSLNHLNNHEIYEMLIPLNLIKLSLSDTIGIGSEFNLTISNQGWPYDNNTAQMNKYPENIQYQNMNSWAKLRLAQATSSSSLNGLGDQGTALLFFKNSTTGLVSDTLKDFSIPVSTNQWGLSFTNLTFTNLNAPNVSRNIEADTETDPIGLASYIHMGFNITNYCTLQNFSVLIRDQFSTGNDILWRIYNATWSGTKPQPNKTLKTGTITTDYTTRYWENVTNVNQVLDPAKTDNKTFFISLRDDTSSGQWYYLLDSIVGGDGVDEGPSFVGNNVPYTYLAQDFKLKVNLIPISNTPTPTQVGMRVNGSAVAANGNWRSSTRFTSSTGKILFDVSANWPLSYTVGYKVNYNKSVNTKNVYFINTGENPNWIVNWSSQFPNNAQNYQMNVSIPIDWTVNNIKNGTYPALGLYSSAHWSVVTTGGHKVVIIKDITNVAVQDWFINCTAPNYIPAINVYRKAGMSYSLLNLADNILITEILHINGTISSPIAGVITDLIHGTNLTTYLSGVRTCYTEDNIKAQKGVASFTDWVIADATNEAGTYIAQVMWANGTEVGLNEVSLKIIYPTSTAAFVDQIEKVAPFSVEWFIGTKNLINITTFYNNTFPDKLGGISTTNASYRIINGTTLWMPWTPLDKEKIGAGYYNKTLDVTHWVNGTYYIGINLNKTGCQVQEFNITLHLGYNTSIALKLPASAQIQSHYPENLIIQVNYTKFTGNMLLSASVNCRINGGIPLALIVRDNLFNIQLNSTDYGVGIYNITIFASQMGYYPRQLYINWTVQICPTDSMLAVNGSYSQFEFYIGEKMSITSYFNDTTHNQPISSAQATLTLIGGGAQSLSSQGLGYYTWILDSSPRAGLWNFSLELKKPDYQNQTRQFEIYVRYNTSLKWSTPPPLTIQPFTELTMAVNLSHLTVSHNQVPVAGQNIIYSITTNLGLNNYSRITNIAGIASFSGYIIPVGVISLSIQVIYAGNLTEFPTNLLGSVIILYPTRADVFVDKVNITGGSLVVYKFIGLQSRVNITVFYYNSTFLTKVGISAATAQYQIINKTGGLWVSWTNLNALGGGYYNITRDVSSWKNDTYYIGIRLNKTEFQMQQFNITMNLVFSTNIVLLQPNSTIIGKFYPENLTISVNYTKATGDEILTAYVRVTINGTIVVPLLRVGELYQIRLNSTAYGIGTYNLSVMASLLGYYPQAINILWIVDVCPTNYQVYVNWSHSPNQFYYGQQMAITIRYYDTAHSVGLQYALVNITLPSGLKQTLGYIGSGNYSIILNSSSRSPGLWDLAFIIQKPNYQNHTFNLQLYARYNTTLNWLSVFPAQATAGQTLSLIVRMSHNDGTPVPGQNITFVIITNNGQIIIPPIFTNASGISSYNYIILSGVSTINIVAVFGGNLTEFSSNVTVSTQIKVIYGGFWENYWWTILIGAVLLIVVMATVRSRRKEKAIKEFKKKEIMSSFQDVTKILHLVVIHKGSGSDIFDYKVQERMDPTLLAGFIQAVKEFGREIDKGEK